jgi:hypothetical protein
MNMNRHLIFQFVWLALPASMVTAQVAITEAMSSSSTNRGAQVVAGGPDFWELTNFGTNDINLTGYRFNDSQGGINQADAAPFQNLVIHGRESILFFESINGAMTVESFRAWWGLDSTVQVVAYTNAGYGFSANPPGDGVRLWGPFAVEEADLVDSVDFGSATRGQSFTYDPITGEFGAPTTTNMLGAFRALTADDIGSPGRTASRVAIGFAQDPVSLTVNPGDTAMFSVRYRGMPRPTFQWLQNGTPIPGARSLSYTIETVQSNHVGQYQVQLSNAFEVITSAAATLTLNTYPMPPIFVVPLTELRIFADQTALFRPVTTGLPQPTFQWRIDGTNVPGATGKTLTVAGPHRAGTNRYSVVASNPLGSATNEASLVVTERPNLHITEIMPASFSFSGPKHEDWWELTNFGTNTVDLFGYRFDDFTEVANQRQQPRLEFAWANTNHIFIQPGESIVFVESMSADAFRDWWGWSKLPANLQIVTYSGALGFSAAKGDGLALWNMGAISDLDVVNGPFTVARYSQLDIVIGTTLTTDETIFFETCCYLASEAGVNGAFIADKEGDVGSPGYIRAPTEPRLLTISMSGNGCRLTWRSVLPGVYVIQYRDRLDAGAWQVLTNVSATGPTTSYVDASISGIQQRFYRVTMAP